MALWCRHCVFETLKLVHFYHRGKLLGWCFELWFHGSIYRFLDSHTLKQQLSTKLIFTWLLAAIFNSACNTWLYNESVVTSLYNEYAVQVRRSVWSNGSPSDCSRGNRWFDACHHRPNREVLHGRSLFFTCSSKPCVFCGNFWLCKCDLGPLDKENQFREMRRAGGNQTLARTKPPQPPP